MSIVASWSWSPETAVWQENRFSQQPIYLNLFLSQFQRVRWWFRIKMSKEVWLCTNVGIEPFRFGMLKRATGKKSMCVCQNYLQHAFASSRGLKAAEQNKVGHIGWRLLRSAAFAPHKPFPISKAKAFLSMLKWKCSIPPSLLAFKALWMALWSNLVLFFWKHFTYFAMSFRLIINRLIWASCVLKKCTLLLFYA